MSADKVLECPRCPFATELRHHLEYHLRSHYGSRPYKCDKCTYRCYNQSMLNSHAKSHTNVYQFRCADCQFAAKYCHSLKVRYLSVVSLHLCVACCVCLCSCTKNPKTSAGKPHNRICTEWAFPHRIMGTEVGFVQGLGRQEEKKEGRINTRPYHITF